MNKKARKWMAQVQVDELIGVQKMRRFWDG